MQRLFLLTAVVLVFLTSSSFKSDPPHRNGDLVFIVNPSGQGRAIQLATGSEFTHVGILFIEDGKEMVYHAVEPVSKNTLAEFIAMSADGKYATKRLKNQSLLSPKKLEEMRKEAGSRLGLHYDLAFDWSDEELYCSEFVWKLYHHALNLSLGDPRPLRSFNLSHPAVKEKLRQRYGDNIPLDAKMISPGDMYTSPLLE